MAGSEQSSSLNLDLADWPGLEKADRPLGVAIPQTLCIWHRTARRSPARVASPSQYTPVCLCGPCHHFPASQWL